MFIDNHAEQASEALTIAWNLPAATSSADPARRKSSRGIQ
jgi:hypothetical protein